jgi:hypothetical protein
MQDIPWKADSHATYQITARFVSGNWKLISALDGSEWSASRPGRFTPMETDPGTHWIGGWVGHRAVLDAVVKRKIPSTRRESNPRTPIVQPVAQRYTDWGIMAHCHYQVPNLIYLNVFCLLRYDLIICDTIRSPSVFINVTACECCVLLCVLSNWTKRRWHNTQPT